MRLSNIQPTIPPNLFCKTNLFFPSPACHCIKRDSIIITEVLFCFQYSQINNNWPHFLANTVGYTTRTSLIGLFYTKCYSYFFQGVQILLGFFVDFYWLQFEQELHKQLLMITEERNCLLSETQQLRFLVAEAEVLKENCDRKAS